MNQFRISVKSKNDTQVDVSTTDIARCRLKAADGEMQVTWVDRTHACIRIEELTVNSIVVTGSVYLEHDVDNDQWILQRDEHGRDHSCDYLYRKNRGAEKPTDAARKKVREFMPRLMTGVGRTIQGRRLAMMGERYKLLTAKDSIEGDIKKNQAEALELAGKLTKTNQALYLNQKELAAFDKENAD